mgnify:CR=1 FL=1
MRWRMKTNQYFKLLEDKNFLQQLYRFSYYRCNTSFEAEDLCSDIVLAILLALEKQEHIQNFYAFAWTIAHRVYANYCQKRNLERQNFCNDHTIFVSYDHEDNEILEEMIKQKQLKQIFVEISFLSKIYREVMIMYYIDELKIKDIAKKLNISETTVKQRLFSARNFIKKEVKTMNKKNYVLKPIHLYSIGMGKPRGNDPRIKMERTFSQNLIYLCKDKPKTAKELSEELSVPMPYVEEELEIQCRGENGEYGMLRQLNDGKYTINTLLVDYDEYLQANNIFEKYLPELCKIINQTLSDKSKKILSFPFLSRQDNLNFIFWSLIQKINNHFEDKVNELLKEKYFCDVKPVERVFSTATIAYTNEQNPTFDVWGCDSAFSNAIGGYQSVFVSNIYGKYLDRHFYVGHNLSCDQKILMLLRSIHGITIDSLTEIEKEIVAQCIECGYLQKNDNLVEPKIVIIDKKDAADFNHLAMEFVKDMQPIIEKIAAELSVFLKKHIPAHLMNEYQNYTYLIATAQNYSKLIDACLQENILSKPKNRLGAEGVFMIVEI